MHALRALVVAGGLLVAARPVVAQDAKPAVMAVVNRLFDGMRAGDSATVRSVFHPRARMLSAGVRNGVPVLGIEESIDDFAKAVGTPHDQVWDERIWGERVAIDGTVASVWVDYAFYRGGTFSHCGIDHFLLVKGEDGAWRIIELADTRRTQGCAPAR